ncbi:poly(A)-specific ribonuclease PARN-like isoform X1 [Argiope bruennichi]|uniref:poly(A)-specific ribonuclease PARN-like isoform X1 n=1 Tax=Argiope bruennichi TaxID=94029 RepID=UPI002494EA35|nr:poly(A)-specific ribonuclease PARN-like isoform X1 [Argiope bruennichi]
MEVTKSNFEELLPSIKKAIDECDFLAIDTELTGLYNARSEEHAFDTMEERYSKLREQCSKFLIIQFGLSTFKYHPEEKKYTHCDFNFYVFPRPHIRQAPDPRFLCQASSLHFLASHGFDFNKTIYEGIPYLTFVQEKKVRDYVTKKYEMERGSVKHTPKANGQKNVDVPDEHKKFIAEINERVDAFISDESQTAMQLEPCSSYLRKLIYESVQSKHSTGIEMSSKTAESGNQRYITIIKCSDQDKLDKLQCQEINDLDDVDVAVGFRKVMDHISASKKLVIGHHMYLDILHVIEQFFFHLPEELSEFKSMVRMTFPNILDTKYVASSERLRPFLESTQLSELLRQVQGRSFEIPPIGVADGYKGYDLTSEHFHEAGYDAFMSGLCYIAMTKKLGAMVTPSVEYVEPSSKILSPYVNRFFILRHFDINGLNLCGPDPEPNRDNVFHVSFPEEWKTIDLVELFLPYGNVYVHWLDDVSALVALKNPGNTVNAKTALLNKSSRVYRVRTYAEYQKWANQQLNSNKQESKKPSSPPGPKSTVSKRKNSGNTESSVACSMDLIPEDDENEAETADGNLRSNYPQQNEEKLLRKKTRAKRSRRRRGSLKKRTTGNNK